MSTCFSTALVGVIVVASLGLSACHSDDAGPTNESAKPDITQSSSTATTSPVETEPPDEVATRLASEQVRNYIEAEQRASTNPSVPLGIFDRYAETQALAAIKESIGNLRASGQRQVGTLAVTDVRLGPEGVRFSDKAPRVVVDIYACYDLNGAHLEDKRGRITPIEPQVAQVRFAVYAKHWPNTEAADWRVGKEYASGEACGA